MQQNSSEAMPPQTQKAALLKKDLIISGVVGLLLGLLILPIIKQSELKIPYLYSLSLIIILPILSVLGMLIALVIAQKIKVIYQLAKFVLVGALNTFVDWGVLNLLMFLANISSGPFYSVFKGASFAVAVTNSYFWNKFWTFKKAVPAAVAEEERKSTGKEVLQFFIVSVIGFALNVGVASLIVNWWGPHFGIGVKLWANVGAFFGTLIGLVWNFLGYKLIVFKK